MGAGECCEDVGAGECCEDVGAGEFVRMWVQGRREIMGNETKKTEGLLYDVGGEISMF